MARRPSPLGSHLWAPAACPGLRSPGWFVCKKNPNQKTLRNNQTDCQGDKDHREEAAGPLRATELPGGIYKWSRSACPCDQEVRLASDTGTGCSELCGDHTLGNQWTRPVRPSRASRACETGGSAHSPPMPPESTRAARPLGPLTSEEGLVSKPRIRNLMHLL